MRDKNIKDEELNALFRAYVEEEESPLESVTDKAKKYMQKQPKRIAVKEPILVTENGTGGDKTGRHAKNMWLIWVSCGVFLFIVALFFLWYFLSANGDPFTSIDKFSIVSRSQLTETSATFSEQEFIPFINSEDVVEYKEYSLTNDNTHQNREVVLYYLEYTEQENTQAKLYVEVGGLNFDELNNYKQLNEYQKFENVTYYVGFETEDSLTYIYFLHDIYSYNLSINTTSETSIQIILEHINNSYNNLK
ncbi:MAG: hypothetical protein ACI4MQ_08515 [Candidatus Coproplasma sp.]